MVLSAPPSPHTAAQAEVEIVSFGCRLNIHESEIIRAHAAAAGQRDLVVINSCAVTREAERQARQAIRRARRERPGARIVVTGCAAQIDPARFAAMAEVDAVLDNDAKLRAESWRGDRLADPPAPLDSVALRETADHLLEGFADRSRAFVQVQNGCDHRCTFCIIPFGRGPSRSIPVGALVEQARTLVAHGYREIVLTGVDLTSYGGDLPGRPSLGQMCRRLLALVPDLPRLRLSSLDPAALDDDLWRLIAEEPRLMPHLHLSVQAGHDMILKRMKRRHRRADVLAIAARARGLRPDIALGADLIAGFPTESDAMFEGSLDLVAEAGLVYLHVFPYSPRPDTPAARMPQVPEPLRKERAARLRAAGDARLAAFLSDQIGRVAPVLGERGGLGRTPNHAPVLLPEGWAPGTLAPLRIAGVANGKLIGGRAPEEIGHISVR